MPSPAARHPELILRKLTAAVGAQDRFNLAAQMRTHADSLFSQRAMQGFGKRRAEHNVHVQLRNAPSERFGFKRTEKHFPSPRNDPTVACHDEQPRRRVEHRRHAFLPDGNGHGHMPNEGTQRAS